ncbi:MAG: cytochrome d ubiquinol oxidase subunit II, partial [Candidatus Eremiobacterota bacterium]
AARQRAVIARAMAPVWEANHVWLVLVVVILFVGFPRAFAALSIALHIPLTLMLIGIVLRGSAFTFRAYDPDAGGLGTRPASRRQRRFSLTFAVASLVTPVMLGICVGAVASGKVVTLDGRPGNFFDSWTGSFPLLLGLFTLALFAFLAATYLTLETDEADLQEDFRLRALLSAGVAGLLAWTCLGLAREQAPDLQLPLAIQWLTGATALGAVLALLRRRYPLARALAVLQVACILWGWGLAQFPYILPPSLTFLAAASPPAVQRLLLGALALGAAVVLPSFVYLYRIFKQR